jgi:DNA-binding CsgD family transcriptional regulator/N-acetylneuraminic acid mutarotase
MYNRCMTSSDNSDLSERELDILRLVATGLSNKEIARKLYISPNTVKVHLRNIFVKIGVLSRTEAALYAVNHGLVKTSPVESPSGVPISVNETPFEEETASHTTRKATNPMLKSILLIGAVLLVLVLVGLGWAAGNSWLNPAPTQVPTHAEAFFPLIATSIPTSQPRWLILPSMPSPRSKLAAVAMNGMVYAIGGETGQNVSDRLEAYDPSTTAWTTHKSKPTPVSEIQAAVLGGKIYVPGGKLNNGEASQQLEIYDPFHDAWERGPDLPYPVSDYALAAFEGKLYLFGGRDDKTIYDRVLEYDPSLQTWNERTPLPTPRYAAAAAEAGGKIYVLGGFDGKNALASNETYTPSLEGSGTSPWDSANPLPAGRYAMGVASIADSLLVIGGLQEDDTAATPYQFFPSTDTWVELEHPDNQSWTYLSAVPLDQKVFVLGGLLDDQISGALQSYQAVYTILLPIVR